MAEWRKLPRSLRRGGLLAGLLLSVAICAPLLATELPWIARGEAGLIFPAFSGWLGLGSPSVDCAETLLAAPIPYAPQRILLGDGLQPPSTRHILGTDSLGRDIASRVVHASRISLAVGGLAAGLALLVGIPLGAIAGYVGGRSDWWIARLIEAALSIPTLLLALVLLAGQPGWLAQLPAVMKVAAVLGLTGWVAVARYLRGEFLKWRDSEMIQAARATGNGHFRIIWHHLLPCSLAPVLVTAAFTTGGAVLMEAALSFLGLGIPPPLASWGGLLNDARERIDTAWWLALFPGLALFLTVLACNLIGEGLRDHLDPGAGASPDR